MKKDKLIGSSVIVIICVIFLFTGYIISKPKQTDSKANDKTNEEIFVEGKISESSFKDNSIMVDIRGAVKKPGVYKLKKESRVVELVKTAGGFIQNADINRVHLSKKLNDEEMIYIYEIGEEDRNDIAIDNNSLLNNTSSDSSSGITSSGKVNLNTASLEELKTLPGVGDVTANRIIEYREKNGGFKSIEELKKISRIGEKTFQKLSDKVDI